MLRDTISPNYNTYEYLQVQATPPPPFLRILSIPFISPHNRPCDEKRRTLEQASIFMEEVRPSERVRVMLEEDAPDDVSMEERPSVSSPPTLSEDQSSQEDSEEDIAPLSATLIDRRLHLRRKGEEGLD
jgi:hypothetical protein